MANFSRIMFRTLTHSYIICLISILSFLIIPGENLLNDILEIIAIYASIITIYFFVFYLITVLLAIISKRK